MNFSFLLRAAGIAGTILFLCAAPAAAQVCTSLILNPVPFVTTPYDPATNATPVAQNRPVNDDVQKDVAAAFAGASHDFQTLLCGLDGIFIDPSNCADPGPGNTYDPNTCNINGAPVTGYSWGLRIVPLNPDSGKRYIGLSLGLWNNNNGLTSDYQWPCQSFHACAPPFSSFYKAFIDTVAHIPSANSPHSSLSVSVLPTSFAANSAMTILAALAHEFGHVFWADRFIVDQNTGAPNPGGEFVNNYFCAGIFYPNGKWEKTVSVHDLFQNSGRFVFFGDTLPYAGSQVPGLPGTLHSIHAGGHWASALAAFSPVEDFVETFELSVLMNAGLKGLQINSHSIVPIPKGSWLDWKIGLLQAGC